MGDEGTSQLLDRLLETPASSSESLPTFNETFVNKSTETSDSATNSATNSPPVMKRGKLTAILSGAVAVLLGVGYLLLASFLDSRELLPPPPEAFDM